MTKRSFQYQRTAYIASITVIGMLIFGVVLPIALLAWQAATPRVLVRKGNVGQFLSAASESTFLRPSVTNVQTTGGSLIVSGLFSAPRGQALEVVQFNQDSVTYLCATGDLGTCLPLAGTWAGPMSATTGRAFAFADYGLATGNLWLWLACGSLVCALAAFTRFVARTVIADANGGADQHRSVGGPRV